MPRTQKEHKFDLRRLAAKEQFAQIPRFVLESNISGNALKIYGILICFAHNEDGVAWPSLKTICTRSQLSRPVVIKSLKQLKAFGLIEILKRKSVAGNHNEYVPATISDGEILQKAKKNMTLSQTESKENDTFESKENDTFESKENDTFESKDSLPKIDPIEIDPIEIDPIEKEKKEQKKKAPTESPPASPSVPALSKSSDDSLNLKGIDNPEASISLAKEWLEWAKSQSPWNTTFTLHSFAEAILTIQRQGKFNHEPVRHLFEYIKRDDFWTKNAISPASLTKRKNGSDMRKWETIMHQMRANKDYRTKVVQNNIAQLGGKSLF